MVVLLPAQAVGFQQLQKTVYILVSTVLKNITDLNHIFESAAIIDPFTILKAGGEHNFLKVVVLDLIASG